jgi:hypothetical protein
LKKIKEKKIEKNKKKKKKIKNKQEFFFIKYLFFGVCVFSPD